MKMFNIVVLLSAILVMTGCDRGKKPPRPTEPVVTELVALESGLQNVPVEPVADRLRICTYNIEQFTDGEGEDFERTPTVVARQVANAAKILDEVGADLVVLQEVENGTMVTNLNAHMAQPYPFTYVTEFGSNKRYATLNLVLLSRIKLLRVNQLFFEGVQADVRVPRGSLAFEADLGKGRHLLGYAVHLKSNWGETEKNQAKREQAVRWVREDADRRIAAAPEVTYEVYVAGDMNTDPAREEFKGDISLTPLVDWVDLWMREDPKGPATIPTRAGDPDLAFPGARFDRIFINRELVDLPWKAKAIHVLPKGCDTNNVFSGPGENDAHTSDHYPVFVDLIK